MSARLDIREITAREAHRCLEADEAVLVDVREAGEYARAHVPGARLNPLSRLDFDALAAPQGKKLIVICRSGNRSLQALHGLRNRRGGTAYNLMGGMMAWEAQGLPVARGERKSLFVTLLGMLGLRV